MRKSKYSRILYNKDLNTKGIIKAMSGEITRLVLQQKNKDRVSVFIDGEFAFGLYKETVLQHGLRKGQTLTGSEITTLQTADGFLAARAYALRLLNMRAQTSAGLRRKILGKGFPEDAVDRIVAQLEERGFLNDAQFARQFAEERLRTKKHGAARIRIDLQKKGIQREVIEMALQKVLKPDETLETARELAKKQWRKLRREPDVQKQRRRLFDFLIRRGYDPNTASTILREGPPNEADKSISDEEHPLP